MTALTEIAPPFVAMAHRIVRATVATVDDGAREWLWRAFVEAPAPVGYDPSIVPAWTDAASPTFGALRLHPWRLQVQPATVLLQGRLDLRLSWREPVDAGS
jgi:hypothetical protein